MWFIIYFCVKSVMYDVVVGLKKEWWSNVNVKLIIVLFSFYN